MGAGGSAPGVVIGVISPGAIWAGGSTVFVVGVAAGRGDGTGVVAGAATPAVAVLAAVVVADTVVAVAA